MGNCNASTTKNNETNIPNKSNDKDKIDEYFNILCDSSNSLEARKEAFQVLRNHYVPNKSSTQEYSHEVSRVFAERYITWPLNPQSSTGNKRRLADSIRGIIFGAAVGDSAGLATEFLSKAVIESHYFRDNQLFNFIPGCEVFPDMHRVSFTAGDWTDDTDQLILALISLLEDGGSIKPLTFAKHLNDWREKGFVGLGDQGGCGLGRSTKAVIEHSQFLTDPLVASKDIWERSGKKLAANGALMRTAITAIPQFWDLDVVKENTINLCMTTHYDPRCQASCLYFTFIIARLLQYWFEPDCVSPMPIEKLVVVLEECYSAAENHLVQSLQTQNEVETIIEEKKLEFSSYAHFQEIRSKEISDLQLDDAVSMGYTLKCLSVAIFSLLQAAEHGMSFPQLMQMIIREGGDADTNATVAGALLGAYYGVRVIPAEWLDAMPYEMWLEAWVQKVLFMLQLPPCRPL